MRSASIRSTSASEYPRWLRESRSRPTRSRTRWSTGCPRYSVSCRSARSSCTSGALAPSTSISPTSSCFDLDPAEDVGWEAVVDAAFLIKERLEGLGLRGFVRLTGGKGLHVVVPVVPGPEWPAVKKFARAFVNEIVREDPRRFTPSIAKSQRGGKIFIDYLRNDREATAIASYSPRARAGAPVALPIEWDELDRDAEHAAALRPARRAVARASTRPRPVGRLRGGAPLAGLLIATLARIRAATRPRRERGARARAHAFLEHAHDVDHFAGFGLVLGDALFDFDDVAIVRPLRSASASSASV